MKLDAFAKQKIIEAQKYILEHDKEFKFYTELVIDSSEIHQLIIQQINHRPSLNRYKIIEQDVNQINQQDFNGIQSIQVVCQNYMKLLYDDSMALNNFFQLARSQVKFRQEMNDILMITKQITQIIRNQLNVSKKGHFMQYILRDIKIFNQKVHGLHLRFQSFLQEKIYDTIDIKHYVEIGDQKDAKKIDIFDGISKVQNFIQKAQQQCESRMQDMLQAPKHNQANRGIQLCVLLQKLFQDQTNYMTTQSSLFNKIALNLYLNHQTIIHQCILEFHQVEPFMHKINESSSELIYLAFILKQEIAKLGGQLNALVSISQISTSEMKNNPALIQGTLQLCYKQQRECEQLLSTVKEKKEFKNHFGEVSHFVGVIRKKMKKRSSELKSLQINTQHFLDALKRIVEVLQVRDQIQIKIIDSSKYMTKVTNYMNKKTKSNSQDFEILFEQSCVLNSTLNGYLTMIERDVRFPSETISKINSIQIELWDVLSGEINKQYKVQAALSYLIQIQRDKENPI